MAAVERTGALTSLARVGFTRLREADAALAELAELTGVARDVIAPLPAVAADPDEAAAAIVRIARRDAHAVADVLRDPAAADALWRLAGASAGFGAFWLRHPDELADLRISPTDLPSAPMMRDSLRDAVAADAEGFAADGTEASWVALRVRYRRLLARIARWDLSQADPLPGIEAVTASLSEAAAAALDASLCVARTRVSSTGPGAGFARAEVVGTRFAVIGMGKCGARELNYVSDVDVVFVGEPAEVPGAPSMTRALEVATRLAVYTTQGISGAEVEPALWEVDANLRPEGSQGALVRTLASHETYYRRWAAGWEFQALMKARVVAGDAALGEAYERMAAQCVWDSSSRDGFVTDVQRMRERVIAHVPPEETRREIKLGEGGLRDIEFTVQLLQLVHGRSDPRIRHADTLGALAALTGDGYIGRADAADFDHDYRVLRMLEHRVQLRGLRRTHLMPDDDEGLRILGRAAGITGGAAAVWQVWEEARRRVRDIHVRLFYRPLLAAAAALPDEDLVLSSDAAHDRLAAIGFTDPNSALRHIAALTGGVGRTPSIQRHLLPVMLRWFAQGADPDGGLIAFRRISERLGTTPWFLRMLRDSSVAAQSLTTVLAGSRYIGELLEWIPDAAAWLDDERLLAPRPADALRREAAAIRMRHDGLDGSMRAVRALRRRELLRTAMAVVLGRLDDAGAASALTVIADVTIDAVLSAVRRDEASGDDDDLEFAVIAMGRLGGQEVGFGSDADVLFVYRPGPHSTDGAADRALRLVTAVRTQAEDQRVPFVLDADLRPEGRSGPLARSLDAYRAYYERWSAPWEAQALLRARGIAGDPALIADFLAMAGGIRYPREFDPAHAREIRRIKARVETERLPQGVARERHLKLGPGGLSDVEWLVQLLQLQHAHEVPGLRTVSTPGALDAAVEAGLVPQADAARLVTAWRLAGRLRSAQTLLTGRTSDVLPADRRLLDGVGRLIGLPAGSATDVEERWLRAARRARRSFERLFYDAGHPAGVPGGLRTSGADQTP